MPEISRFYGIIIRMFYNEHNPPHFHVFYNEFTAEFNLVTLEIVSGKLPNRVLALALEWAYIHRTELMQNWELMRNDKPPKPIEPLN